MHSPIIHAQVSSVIADPSSPPVVSDVIDLHTHEDSSNPVVAALVDGKLFDLGTRLPAGTAAEAVKPVRLLDEQAQPLLRHSMAHLTAQAVQRLFGKFSPAQRRIHQGVGPATKDGFFQEFDFAGAEIAFSPEMLTLVEKAMCEIVRESLKITRRIVTRQEAQAEFHDDPLKQGIIARLPEDEPISIYTQGEYTDLCRGPHVPSTEMLGAFKLLLAATGSQTGVTDEPLLRITGTGFATAGELQADLTRREEALKRDHRKIGPAMELFYMSDMAPGAAFFLPNGVRLRQVLIDEKRRLLAKYGFDEVATPTLFRKQMWEISGHWSHYADHMFRVQVKGYEGEQEGDYALKPMNCPGHVLLYQRRPRSYREFPLRFAEFGTVHRYELSGALSGLHRVRTFTQDDAHLFVRPDQLHEEVTMLVKLYLEFYEPFGFSDLRVHVSTRPKEKLGTEEEWNAAEEALIGSLSALNIPFTINPGDGAFYGPKIDFHLSDCLGRSWQLGTIQVDFQLPQRFGLSYIGAGGISERPIMIHPATMGSIERFMAVIIEHFAGKFPSWLAPVQVKILPVSENQVAYAQAVGSRLRAAGICFDIVISDERLAKKIREAQPARAPYLLILGALEEASETISVRDRAGAQMNAVDLAVFISTLQTEIAQRAVISNLHSFDSGKTLTTGKEFA